MESAPFFQHVVRRLAVLVAWLALANCNDPSTETLAPQPAVPLRTEATAEIEFRNPSSGSTAATGSRTYLFAPYSAGNWRVTGFFTTDGTIGPLKTSNILSSSVAITDGNITYFLGIPVDDLLCHFDGWAYASLSDVTIPNVGPDPAMDWCNSSHDGVRISIGGSDPQTIYFFGGGARLTQGFAAMPFALTGQPRAHSLSLTVTPSAVQPVFARCFDAVSQVATQGNTTAPVCPSTTPFSRTDVVVGSIIVAPPDQGVPIALDAFRRRDSGGHLEPYHSGNVKGRFKDTAGNWVPTLALLSDQTGRASFMYRSSGVSGVDSITANTVASAGPPDDHTLLNVQLTGLYELLPILGLLRQGRLYSHHSNIWYGTANANFAARATAKNYQTVQPFYELISTAVSLPLGGLADVNFNWTYPHLTHRAGHEYDFTSTAGKSLLTLTEIATAGNMAGGTCKIELFANSANNHTHCKFP